MTNRDALSEWENRYLDGRTGFDRGEASPALSLWIENRTLKPCRLLVPGCGRGHEVVAFVKAGFEVTAIDIAPSAIAALREKLEAADLSASLVLGDFFDWQPDQPFDAIYEQTSLCAIPPEMRSDYEEQLGRWLKSGGILAALFMQTHRDGGPPFHCDMDEMRRLFDPDRWNWSTSSDANIAHPSGGIFEIPTVLTRK